MTEEFFFVIDVLIFFFLDVQKIQMLAVCKSSVFSFCFHKFVDMN